MRVMEALRWFEGRITDRICRSIRSGVYVAWAWEPPFQLARPWAPRR